VNAIDNVVKTLEQLLEVYEMAEFD